MMRVFASPLEKLGAMTEDGLSAFGGLGQLFSESLGQLVRLRLRVGETIDQAIFLGMAQRLLSF